MNRLKLVSGSPVEPPKLVQFETVYDAEWGHVWRWLEQLGVQQEDLADLAQEVFIRAFGAWDRSDLSRPMRPWLFGIAYRVMLGFRRQVRHRLEVVGVTGESEDANRSADEMVALGERRRLFLSALRAMDAQRRAVFVLHEVEGYTAPEIADTLEEPLSTVYSRLRIARREFSAAVREQRRSGGLDD